MAVSIDIEKQYPDFHLRVKFESSQSSTGILGASGSGKSMTLRCIAGIETPDTGKIIINGRTVFDSEEKINLKPQERRIGYLFQNYALFPTMTVKKNIACGYRGKKADLADKVRDYIERYQLNGLEKRYPFQLSGGQQQRVALARMMIGEPEAILLDEPFSALDGYLKDVLQRDMKNFLKSYGGDMILVTHSRDEVFKFCDRLTLLKEGKALITGETRKIFEKPQLLEAARLTGCRNFSSAFRLGEHSVYAVDWDMPLVVPEKVEEGITHVGIRGHWIRPVKCAGENCMPVEMIEYAESTFEHQYLVRSPGKAECTPLWWMCPKKDFKENPMADVPDYLYLPGEHIMLLKEG